MVVYEMVKILLTNIIQYIQFISIDKVGSNSRLPTSNRDSTSKLVSSGEYRIISSSILSSSVEVPHHPTIIIDLSHHILLVVVAQNKIYLLIEVCIHC
jgi:hypothetical protein